MTTTYLKSHHGVPAIYLNGERISAPVTAYVGPRYTGTFQQAGVQLYTFGAPGAWWVGPGRYDFDPIDEFLGEYVKKIPGGFFMPRVDFSRQGFPWWGATHPEEMNVLRSIASGEVCDQLAPNPRALPYLGHEVNLNGLNLHSFHSRVWREEAGRAIAALVSHCEAQPYAGQIWAWHICDGLFCEWFHWNEYSFEGMADYSPAARADFRAWLRRRYQDDPAKLASAWGRQVGFDEIEVPAPAERMRLSHGEFYDPVRDRPTIDYAACFSEATVDSIVAVCQAVKDALPQPKLTCVFYGYQFSNMPRPQLNAHYALRKLLDSPAVDMLASPHAYSNRGEGGYHSPQCVADSVRRAGKLHFDEIDCKTVWTPASVTWKRHISQPTTVAGTIEMMKKDAAYQMASATAQWWMDLTDQGWFNAPEAVEPMRRLKAISERLEGLDRAPFAEVALVVSQPAMAFCAPREGLHNATLKMFRNWHLSRMGAPFEQLLLDDLARPDLPAYKLYIMANLFYLSAEERRLVERVLKRNGATALWIYAPGYLDDASASLENMRALTGIRMGMAEQLADLNVRLTAFTHPITHGLGADYAYGTGVLPEQYLQPPRTQYLPEMSAIGPAFFADDPEALVLGLAESTGKPGLALKELDGWRSIYSAAPLIPWELMRNIARYAGAHVFVDQGDMLWANRSFLALYSQGEGKRLVRFPAPVTLEDAYEAEAPGRAPLLGEGITSYELEMRKWETRLFIMR